MFKKKLQRLLSSEINSKIFSYGTWILFGNLFSKAVFLLATIIIAHFLGKEEYGQFGIIKSTILMFSMFAGIELGITATKFISQYRKTDKEKVEKIVGLSNFLAIMLSLLCTVIVFIFARTIAVLINAPNLYTEIRISAFILFFASLNGVQGGILSGLEKFKELSINNAIAGTFSSLAIIAAAKFFGLDMVIIAFGLNYFLMFLLNFITLRKEFYSDFKVSVFNKKNFDESKVLWTFSLPAVLAGLMVTPTIWICNYFLVNSPNGYAEMANFDVANQWRNTILFIPVALSQIALPMLASKVEDKSEYKAIFSKNLKINFFIGFAMVLVFCLISPVILRLYGVKYSNALLPLIIMFISTGLISVNNVIGQAIASQGKMWLGFYVNLLWGTILMALSYILIVKFDLGAFGLAIAYLVSYSVHTVVQFFYISKFIR